MSAVLPTRLPTAPARVFFFALLALEAAAALVALAAIPPDPKNSLLLGYSLNRLALMTAALGVLVGAGILVVWSARRSRRLEVLLKPPRYFELILATLLVFSLAAWLVLVVLRADLGGGLTSYAVRLRPLLVLAWLLAWQIAGWLWFERRGFPALSWRVARPWARPAAVAGAALAGVVLFVTLTGIGVTPDLYAWNSAGVPLLAWQAGGIALLGLLLFLCLPRAFGENFGPPAHLDWILSLLLWLVTAAVWLSQPVTPSYYAPLRLPNLAFYPYSDASFYDLSAQQLLLGNGYNGFQVVTRPLYILFLGLAHALVGQEYTRVVALQTVLLALFPVGLYWLGHAYHSRAAGVALALFAVVRELNAFAATPLTEVSHSKLLLTDFPTALGVTGFSLLAAAWLRTPHRRWLPLAAGAGLGFLVLLRAQSVIFLPFVLLLALAVYRRKLRLWLATGLLFGLGFGLAILPWVARNYTLTGKVVFDQSTNQSVIFGQRYSQTADELPAALPGENAGEFSARMMASARDFALRYPGYTARFIAAHFLNNEVATLAVLPFKFSLDDYRDTLALKSVFWADLFGIGRWDQLLALGFYLVLIAIGLGAAWRRLGAVGMLPLVLNLAYSLSNAVARNSGWRYILPVDWVAVFYAVIGALALAAVVVNRAAPVDLATQPPQVRFPWRSVWLLAGGILALGAVIPLAEQAFPRRFTPEDKSELAVALAERVGGVVTNRAADENTVLLRGLALYPRYYEAGQGEAGSGWPVFAVRDDRRLAFILVGPNGNQQILLSLEDALQTFPNATEVLIMGCKLGDQKFIQADVIAVVEPPGQVYQAPSISVACP